MRRTILIPLMLALATASCASARKTEAAAVATYTAVVQTLTDLRRSDRISDGDWETIKRVIVVARSAREDVKRYREEGAPESLVLAALETFANAVASLSAYEEAHRG